MLKRALIERRPKLDVILLASLVAGISFYFVKDSHLPEQYQMAWKGAGVALLAVYALVRGGSGDARQIAAVLAFGALGDVLIELALEWGAAAFLIGHLIAIQLYLRHPRPMLSASQKLTGLALLVLTPLIAWRLSASPLVAVYALALGGMAGSAWTSSFPRYRVGIGAVLFVASDLLIFAGQGVLTQSTLPGLLIWPLYYFGQFMICVGVVGSRGNIRATSAHGVR